MAELYILTGSNGAGKSSMGRTLLPKEQQRKVFDGDKLFVQKRNEF